MASMSHEEGAWNMNRILHAMMQGKFYCYTCYAVLYEVRRLGHDDDRILRSMKHRLVSLYLTAVCPDRDSHDILTFPS